MAARKDDTVEVVVTLDGEHEYRAHAATYAAEMRAAVPPVGRRADRTTFATFAAEMQRWNGFVAAPYFDPPELRRLLADMEAEIAADPEGSRETVPERFAWVGGKLIHTDLRYGEPPDEIEPDAFGRYAIGAFAWTWYEVEQ